MRLPAKSGSGRLRSCARRLHAIQDRRAGNPTPFGEEEYPLIETVLKYRNEVFSQCFPTGVIDPLIEKAAHEELAALLLTWLKQNQRAGTRSSGNSCEYHKRGNFWRGSSVESRNEHKDVRADGK